MLKLKSENLPICEKELQQRWSRKPPENTPVSDNPTTPVSLFLFPFFSFCFSKEGTTENYLTIGNKTKII